MIEFINPQSPTEMLTGKATQISTQYHQVKAGGDIAAILGLCKHVFAADDAAKATANGCSTSSSSSGTQAALMTFEAMVRALDWSLIEQESGLTREALEGAAQVYVEAERVTAFYGMGLTQQVHGFENVALLVNLMLLKGNIGRDGTGVSPVRGHSNVQGQRTVGISEKPEECRSTSWPSNSALSRRARRA